MNVSLRQRLVAWLSMSILGAGSLAATLSFALSWRSANDLQDTQIEQVAHVLGHDGVSARRIEFQPRDHEDAETHYVIKRLSALAPHPDAELDLALPESLPTGLQTLEERGVRWRVLVTQDGRGVRFAIAQRMTVRDEVARDSALLTLLPLVLLVPLLLVIVGMVLRQGFAPMKAMSIEVDRLEGHRLRPLDEREVPLEALPLVQAVNRLMRRLALALEQQRRLVSDAAHELRTPVAALLVQADNVQHVDLPEPAKVRMAALRQGLTRMSSMLDQLLSFARVQGAAPSTPQRLELNALVRAAIEETLPLALAKQVDLGCVRADPVSIAGDSLHAYALVRNAIDNAVRYTPDGGAVDVSVSVVGIDACLIVEDTGPGIAEGDLARVFDPFVRLLGTKQSGSGLGLAIARTASDALGGRIQLGPRRDRRSGLRFVYWQTAA